MHVFQDDEPESAVQNALEILGVNSSNLDMNTFRFIEGDTGLVVSKPNSHNSCSKPSATSISQEGTAVQQTNSSPALLVLASVALVLLAIVLQQLLNQ